MDKIWDQIVILHHQNIIHPIQMEARERERERERIKRTMLEEQNTEADKHHLQRQVNMLDIKD